MRISGNTVGNRLASVIVLERGDSPPTAAKMNGHEATGEVTVSPTDKLLQGNLARVFLTVARCRPRHPAIVTSTGTYSY